MAELKPCPFCGSEKERITSTSDFDGSFMVFAIRCDDCGASTRWYATRKKAIAAWNKRS